MCGIVGYVGSQNAVEVITEALSRLEYRGYDSAGICLKERSGSLTQYKKTGKLDNLTKILAKKNPFSHMGLGHTRWATHGMVTDSNAHPHGNEKINLVHNGIIENAKELKYQLTQEGWAFRSETDSEVFLVLVMKYLKTHSLENSVIIAFKKIKGNSAFVVIEKGSDKIIAVKRAVPLVCGKNANEEDLFISSDPYALIGYATEVFFPGDDVVCILDRKIPEKIRFIELDSSPSKRVLSQKQDKDLPLNNKGEFDHYMLKEICEQPKLIKEFIDFYLEKSNQNVFEQIRELRPQSFHISACGTAWHAGLCIKNFIEKNNKIRVFIDLASEFRYNDPLFADQEISLFISQSGETADTLAAQKLCQEKGLKTISIVNVEGSTLFRQSDYNLMTKAGQEVGVASTKAFTLMVLTGYLLSKKLAGEDIERLRPQIELLVDRMEGVLAVKDQIQSVAHSVYQKGGFLYTGRGKYFPIALESALKLKEIAYVQAEGYAAGELKHGPIALIDEHMVNIALVGPERYEKTLNNIAEVSARKGIVVAIGPKRDDQLANISDHFLELDLSGLDELSPLLLNLVTQLLAYYVAKYKGTDIDKPRNLAKSVTVE